MDFNSLGLLILRLGLGTTMAIQHGLPKLLDFSNKMHGFSDPLGVGSTLSLSLVVSAELLCAIAVAIGLFTRVLTVPLIVTMAVAFFMIHRPDAFNVRELPFIYLIGFITLFCTGPGAFSADAIFRKVK